RAHADTERPDHAAKRRRTGRDAAVRRCAAGNGRRQRWVERCVAIRRDGRDRICRGGGGGGGDPADANAVVSGGAIKREEGQGNRCPFLCLPAWARRSRRAGGAGAELVGREEPIPGEEIRLDVFQY